MRSFFDPALIEQWGGAFIREDKLQEGLARLIPRVHITKGHFSYPAKAELRDLAWNHMDQNHRPHIHRTYGDAIRVHIAERSAFSLTRFGKWPVVLPVFDGQHKENGFYQIVCLFGLIVVVTIIECNAGEQGTRMDIDWAIASHRLLRFLHRPLDRRLRRLNDVQNREDEVMRDRRVELRAAGYTFLTDAPDFVNTNAVANNVVFPPLAAPLTVPLADIAEGEVRRLEVGNRAYLVRRIGEAFDVWPGVCPHEGAVLEGTDVRGSTAKCPWHGLEYGARRLSSGSAIAMCGARLELSQTNLTIRPTQPSVVHA
jgi:nitrite reductase/ring-hydroxylating ferredoxin subunit